MNETVAFSFDYEVFNVPNGNHARGGVGRVISRVTARRIQDSRR